jgi:endonuclease G
VNGGPKAVSDTPSERPGAQQFSVARWDNCNTYASFWSGSGQTGGFANMRSDTLEAIHQRIAATRTARMETRDLVADGHADLAEDDPTRNAAYTARAAKSLGTPEAVSDTNDFQPAAFLTAGAAARRSVARVLVQATGESRSGSGFLISPDLFITNQHVINDGADALQTNVFFDDELDRAGRAVAKTVHRLAPERFALFSDEGDLDYALVALGDRIEGTASVDDFGYCPLGFSPDRHRVGMNVNIIQHPNGLPKLIAVRNNLLTGRKDSRLFYETDTDVGSSGSPVTNDQWDIVALHHYGDADIPAADAGRPAASRKVVNEGIRISAIYEDLQKKLPTLDAVAQEILERALKLWTDTTPSGKKLERRPSGDATRTEALNGSLALNESEVSMATSSNDQAVLTIPLEVSIRVGSTAPLRAERIAALAPTPPPTASNRKLRATPERARLDSDYANRDGYDPAFIPGVALALDVITKPRKRSIAPLNAGQRKDGRLDYQNFSVVMHGHRRLALITATNIDGPSYEAIDRKTGERAEHQPEGETWYRDSRIDEASTVGLDFYAGWSHLFDRGHLTRRNDPTWGTHAARANVDTFHLTNCSPQHWKFNESIKFWQGIERYVLEQGLFATHLKKKLSVFQGPILDDADDLWADDVQVPSAFWKIVVWKGKTGLKAVAMIVDQTRLMTLERQGGIKPPPDDAKVEVSEFQSSVATVASRTGLDFSTLASFDTAGQVPPTVGEKLAVLTKWSDVKLG